MPQVEAGWRNSVPGTMTSFHSLRSVLPPCGRLGIACGGIGLIAAIGPPPGAHPVQLRAETGYLQHEAKADQSKYSGEHPTERERPVE